MPLDNPKTHPGYVPAYQVSAIPYVTSSAAAEVGKGPDDMVVVEFPYVTRFFTITNWGNQHLSVGFTQQGLLASGGYSSSFDGQVPASTTTDGRKNYFTILSGTTSPRLELRVKKLFFEAHAGGKTAFSLIAGLTGIHTSQFPTITGSDGFQGVG
jgi:hypothetical protein